VKFLVQYKPALLVEGQIYVSADRWWDAREIGVLHYECEREFLGFERAEYVADDEIDVETRWHGMPPAQRLQFRMCGGDWLDVGEYYDEKRRDAERFADTFGIAEEQQER